MTNKWWTRSKVTLIFFLIPTCMNPCVNGNCVYQIVLTCLHGNWMTFLFLIWKICPVSASERYTLRSNRFCTHLHDLMKDAKLDSLSLQLQPTVSFQDPPSSNFHQSCTFIWELGTLKQQNEECVIQNGIFVLDFHVNFSLNAWYVSFTISSSSCKEVTWWRLGASFVVKQHWGVSGRFHSGLFLIWLQSSCNISSLY